MITFLKNLIAAFAHQENPPPQSIAQTGHDGTMDKAVPVVSPRNIPTKVPEALSLKAALASANTPPVHIDVPPRVAVVDAKGMAEYWKESLSYLDMSAIGSFGKESMKKLDSLSIVDALARSAADDSDGDMVEVVVCLWQTKGANIALADGMRHPLLSIPAYRQKDGGLLFPRTEATPLLNEEYLAPGLGKHAFSLGYRDLAHTLLAQKVERVLEDESLSIGWTDYLQLLIEYLCEQTEQTSVAELELHLSNLANEVLEAKDRAKKGGSRKAEWRLVAAVYESKSGAIFVEKAYTSLINSIDKEKHSGHTSLFRQLCQPSKTEDISLLPKRGYDRYCGHMDERAPKNTRSLFPLDESQRDAVVSILSLEQGQIQAINGPPGSGKTSMLRAVVASMWVDAAWRNKSCPIIVACGATNQSVTNVIDAFGQAPHLDEGIPFAQRWIADVPSYGGYIPSRSVLNNPKKEAELKRLVTIQPVYRGFPFEYWGRPNVLDPSKAVVFEAEYRKHGAKLFGEAHCQSVESVVTAVWQQIDRLHREQDQFILAVEQNLDWLALANAHITTSWAGSWTDRRREIAHEKLKEIAEKPDSRWQAMQDFMDLAWRAQAFHWTARYWEGKFLLAQRERLLSRHPLNVGKALERMCMLTPCLVSTLHMVPQLVKIDEEFSEQVTYREHSFGVFDLLVVDEAGQALPQLASIAFAFAKTAAVVGDLKQLAPISETSAMAERAIARKVGMRDELDGIARSQRSPSSGSALGMARLVSRYRDGVNDGVTLKYHYRCKPSIFEYCNELCYNKDLTARTDEDAAFVEPSLGWVEVDAEPSRSGGSYSNIAEANEIVDWIVERWPAWRTGKGTAGKPIQGVVAIVTPYKAQSDYFLEAFKTRIAPMRSEMPEIWPSEKDIEEITIGTVHRLQGAERPIICFSLVEGPDQSASSFIDQDPSMMNVAVSRAKQTFIIFANPKRLFGDPGAVFGSSGTPTHKLGQYLRRPETPAKRLYPNRLMLIEAPGKLRTLELLLGKETTVLATGGAVTNLPLQHGVDVTAGLVPRSVLREYTPDFLAQAKGRLATLSDVYIATDNDRMGEYIAWNVMRLLKTELHGKTVRRLRLGAVSKLAIDQGLEVAGAIDPNMVLAEAVREVMDCLITQRFTELAKAVKPAVTPIYDELMKIGAVVGPGDTKVGFVGRVQAAVLRILLDEARDVHANSNLRKIVGTVHLGSATVHGVFKEVGSTRPHLVAEHAEQLAADLTLGQYELGAVPLAESVPFEPSLPGTADILGLAWRLQRPIAPKKTMESLQALYSGSWSSSESTKQSAEATRIEPPKTLRGHPPIMPLDADSTPENMQGRMAPDHFAVYSIVWDFYRVAAYTELSEEHFFVRLRNTKLPALELEIEGVSIEGLPQDLQYVLHRQLNGSAQQGVAAVKAVISHLPAIRLVCRDVLAKQWTMGLEALLWRMEDTHIGRPSTFANAIHELEKQGLLSMPVGAGAVQLTSAGLATALALEQAEGRLSNPTFSGEMTARLRKIELGELGPREVLSAWLPLLVPDVDHEQIGKRIWNTLPELENTIDHAASCTTARALVTRGDATTDEPKSAQV